MKTNDLIAEITDRPVRERAQIAEAILATLHQPNPDIDTHGSRKWIFARKRSNVETLRCFPSSSSINEETKEVARDAATGSIRQRSANLKRPVIITGRYESL